MSRLLSRVLSRFVKGLTVSAVIAVAAASTPAVAAADPGTTTDPAIAAAGWLAQQLINGDHLVFAFDGKTFDGGGTADLIYALAAAKSGADDIGAALTYLEKHVAEYTMINDTSGKPGPADGGIGKATVAAIVAGADPTSFGGFNLPQALKDDECKAVSGDPNDFTVPVCPAAGAGRNVFSSIAESFVILAEARAAAIDASFAPSAAAVSYFLSLQCADGGFTSATTGATPCTSDIDATGYAVMALQALGGHDTQIGKAADWLVSKRASNGAWSSQGGANIDSTGLAAAALEVAGRSSVTSRSWLISQQMTTGPTVGKGASRGALKFEGAFDPSLSIKGTSDGMLGLVAGTSLATLVATGATAQTAVLTLAAPAAGHSSVRQGATQSITGTGFSAREKVAGVLHSAPVTVATATANAKGTVTLRFVVPGTVAAGTHTLTLTGASSGLSSSVQFNVAAAPVAPRSVIPSSGAGTLTPPLLAATGRDTRQTHAELLVGVGLLAAGGVALLLGRRRPRRR